MIIKSYDNSKTITSYTIDETKKNRAPVDNANKKVKQSCLNVMKFQSFYFFVYKSIGFRFFYDHEMQPTHCKWYLMYCNPQGSVLMSEMLHLYF